MGALALLRGEPPAWAASGYGYGYGYGYGDGYGSGSGSGSGSGYGYGYGYGSGYGDGYGDGDGDGYGDGSYWLACLKYFAAKWTAAQHARLEELQRLGAKICYWRSNDKGLPANGGRSAVAAAPGVVHEEPGPLNMCHKGTLHATLIPPKWQGERMWAVALIGEIEGDDEKYGALKREIIGECL